MRKPSLTFDTLVAALAVLGASASAGCSKADRASASPEPASGTAAAPAATASAAHAAEGASAIPPAAVAAPGAPPAPEPTPQAGDPSTAPPTKQPSKTAVTATPVDGGAATKKKADSAKDAPMSCGAGTCSADMKKGN